MSDVNRIDAVDDTERLPWLEAVDDEEQRSGAGAGTLVAALIAALVALGLVVGGVFWLRDRGRESVAADNSEGELIAAPAGAYKVKPAEPGGMKVEGQGDAAYAASTGADVNASIDIAAVPEAPVARPHAKAKATPAAAQAPVMADAGAPPRGSGTIQLGSFSSASNANQAWKTLSGRFAYLKPLTSAVTPVTVGGSKFYRLRAVAGGQAQTVCGKLRVAGETCAVVSY